MVLIVLVLFLPLSVRGEEGIVNGQIAPYHPSIVRVQQNGFCTGVLIHPMFVLTAKHCYKADGKPGVVTLGMYGDGKQTGRMYSSVVEVYDIFQTDVVLLQLQEFINLPFHIQPTAVSDELMKSNDYLFSYGLGRKNHDQSTETLRMMVLLTDNVTADDTVCLNGLNSSRVAPGDSGSPVMKDNRVIGIVIGYTEGKSCVALLSSYYQEIQRIVSFPYKILFPFVALS